MGTDLQSNRAPAGGATRPLDSTTDAEAIGTTLRAVVRSWPIIVLSAVVAVIAAVAFSETRAQQYSATATLLFGDGAYEQLLLGYNPVDAQRRSQTSADLISLSRVARAAADQLGDTNASEVLSQVEANASETSDLLQVTATAPTARAASRTANAVADAYLAMRRELNESTVEQTREKLRSEEAASDSRAARRQLETQFTQLDLLSKLQDQQLRIVEPATVPGEPLPSNTVRNALIALLLGLLVGIAVALARGTPPARAPVTGA
jgi:succinoglycan biosynthesis transport protein ExoP